MTAYTQTTAEVTALHQHQELLSQAQQQVQKLTSAISAQQAKAQELQKHQATLERLQTQHQDLLADIATGEKLSDERAALEAQIAQAQKALEELHSDAATAQTLVGLQRKLDQAQANLSEIQGKTKSLLRQLIKAEAEILGHEYATMAQALFGHWMRVRCLSDLWQRYDGHLPLFSRFELQIPTMQLDSVKRFKHVFHKPDVLLSTDFPCGQLLPGIREEEIRLAAAGVVLPSADE